jgi:hypothetical protein
MSFIRYGRRLGWVLQSSTGHLTDSGLGSGGNGSWSGTSGAKG